MSVGFARRIIGSGVVLMLSASATALVVDDAGFTVAMDAAMHRMHAAMTTIYSGDPDRDFAAMMVPHHQGAVDMAGIELRYGRDERLRRLAQAIIVEQHQEIALMQAILAEPHLTPEARRLPDHNRGDAK